MILVRLVELYLLIGAGFAIWFAWRGAGRLDPVAAAGTAGFRWMILPAATALWPLLAFRILTARSR